MKLLSIGSVKLLQNSKLCLFGITVGLTGLHLLLTWKLIGDVDRLIISILFWGAILCLVWRKRDDVNLESGICSSFLGLVLIGLILFKSISLFWFESSFVRVMPLFITSSLCLLASGIKGLKQYWRELVITLLLCLPESSLIELINEFFKITTLTTKFATFSLWYLGLEVSRQGANVILPNGAVLVSTACTGTSTALLLLKLSVFFILMFHTDWKKKLSLLLGAIFIAFIISGIRIAILATVVSNHESFNYWHGSEGSQIFSTISILIFGLFCRILRSQDELASPDSVNS